MILLLQHRHKRSDPNRRWHRLKHVPDGAATQTTGSVSPGQLQSPGSLLDDKLYNEAYPRQGLDKFITPESRTLHHGEDFNDGTDFDDAVTERKGRARAVSDLEMPLAPGRGPTTQSYNQWQQSRIHAQVASDHHAAVPHTEPTASHHHAAAPHTEPTASDHYAAALHTEPTASDHYAAAPHTEPTASDHYAAIGTCTSYRATLSHYDSAFILSDAFRVSSQNSEETVPRKLLFGSLESPLVRRATTQASSQALSYAEGSTKSSLVGQQCTGRSGLGIMQHWCEYTPVIGPSPVCTSARRKDTSVIAPAPSHAGARRADTPVIAPAPSHAGARRADTSVNLKAPIQTRARCADKPVISQVPYQTRAR